MEGWVPQATPLSIPFNLSEQRIPFAPLGCQSREQPYFPLGSFHTHFAYLSEWHLSDLSFCMFLLLRSSLSYVKKAIRLVSVYFKQNGC